MEKNCGDYTKPCKKTKITEALLDTLTQIISVLSTCQGTLNTPKNR